jgi:two-component system response regulator RpfG
MGVCSGRETGEDRGMNVLIVDDQASQRAILRHLVQDIDANIRVTDFADPVQALLWSQQEPPDMVILDYRMPKMDGLEFARRFRRPLSQRDVPVMLVTVVGDEPLRQAALDAGIIDFMVKPIRPRELRSRCKNLLDLRQRQQALKSRTHVLEHQLVSGTHEMERSELGLVIRLARLAATREGIDPALFERIGAFAGVIAREAGMDAGTASRLAQSAQLHDIGNAGIPDALLRQPGPLSPEQRLEMQQHTVLGHAVLQGESDLLQLAAEVALNHHERWDGSGYPRRLAGGDIPASARIVALADALDAMLSPRPWRPAMGFDQAMAEACAGAGAQFEPELVAALRRQRAELEAIHRGFVAAGSGSASGSAGA